MFFSFLSLHNDADFVAQSETLQGKVARYFLHLRARYSVGFTPIQRLNAREKTRALS